MKLLVRALIASGLLVAALVFTSCSAPTSLADVPLTSDASANPPAMTSDASANPPAMTSAEQTNTEVARFHVGETVNISFSGTPDPIPEHEEQIKEDGNITLPYVKSVKAVGKTAGELQNEIHDLYVPKYYVRLTVTVKPGDLVYYVSGEVKSPGRQLYVGETTVIKAITSAGDFTDFASHTVKLIRASGQVIKVDVDKALEDPTLDLQVYPGDQVNVHRRIF